MSLNSKKSVCDYFNFSIVCFYKHCKQFIEHVSHALAYNKTRDKTRKNSTDTQGNDKNVCNIIFLENNSDSRLINWGTVEINLLTYLFWNY